MHTFFSSARQPAEGTRFFFPYTQSKSDLDWGSVPGIFVSLIYALARSHRET
jgi:hypothetical protein